MNMGKPLGKHLDRSKREVIVNCLEKNCTAKEIGELVNLDPTNVSREIKKKKSSKKRKYRWHIILCRLCQQKELS